MSNEEQGGEQRESIYTQFARSINKFVEHKSTKEDLYNDFVALVEMSDEDERNDRKIYEAKCKELYKDRMIVDANEIPYSNWEDGRKAIWK